MNAPTKHKQFTDKCKNCATEYNVEIEHHASQRGHYSFFVKTTDGKFSDNVIFMEDDGVYAGVKCPKCQTFNKIKVDE